MIFVDTWAWIALANKRDQYHVAAQAQHQQLLQAGRKYVTTNFVLGECITFLYRAASAAQAQSFIDEIFTAAKTGSYQLVHISADEFDRAWLMRVKYHDKPDISFVDFTSP